MFGGKKPHGFTIVEIMIFLGVSGLLFLSVLGLIYNQQNQTDFSQGIHEVFSQIQNLSNNVQVGYYNNSNNFSCNANAAGGAPVISSANGNSQGANYGCTYIGRIIQFAPKINGKVNNQEYIVYTVVGRQFIANSNPPSPITDLSDAMPALVTPSLNETVENLPPGLVISSVSYSDANFAGGKTNYDSLIGFFSNFPQSNGSGSLSSGSLSSELIPVPSNAAPLYASTEFINTANTSNFTSQMLNGNGGISNEIYSTNNGLGCSNLNGNGCTVENPSGGVLVCLQSTGLSNTYGVITVGGSGANGNTTGNPLSVQVSVHSGSTCP